MTIDDYLRLAQMSIETAVIISAPVLVLGLIAGLAVSIFQAATQINDAALAFIPKIGAAVNAFILESQDRLLVEGNLKQLTELSDRYGLRFIEEEKREASIEEKKEKDLNLEFHEILVMPNSLISQITPQEVYLRNRYRISLIAINRHGQTLRNELSSVKIQSGDILVVQFLGQVDNSLLDYLGLIPMQKITQTRFKSEQAKIASAIFIAVFIIGSLSSFPLTFACLGGATLMVMLKILKIDEVYEALDLKILIFIACVLALGKAMQNSGTDQLLALHLSNFLVDFNPYVSLSFFFVLTSVLTSLLSNQATAVVMIPIAISTASALNLEPMPFVMSVTIAASSCFVTPFEPALMLVYGPGEYKFKDFFKLGFLLNIISAIVGIIMISYFWEI
jgi:di/tricarboxylate transporter/flagellar biosynthesis protein FliQ